MQAVKQRAVPLLCRPEISGSCCYNVAGTEQPADLRPAPCAVLLEQLSSDFIN